MLCIPAPDEEREGKMVKVPLILQTMEIMLRGLPDLHQSYYVHS